MPRGLLAGGTDYSHQTLKDIIGDLNVWKEALSSTVNYIHKAVEKLQEDGYWYKVPDDMKDLVAYANKFYNTSIVEIDEVLHGIGTEVKQHHINRLRNLANTASELNREFGRVWHQEYVHKEYGKPIFSHVEQIYVRGRDMAAKMLDIGNAAERLGDYLGLENKSSRDKLNKHKKDLVVGAVISAIIALTANVASNIWPPALQPYLWLAWPILFVVVAAYVILIIKY